MDYRSFFRKYFPNDNSIDVLIKWHEKSTKIYPDNLKWNFDVDMRLDDFTKDDVLTAWQIYYDELNFDLQFC